MKVSVQDLRFSLQSINQSINQSMSSGMWCHAV